VIGDLSDYSVVGGGSNNIIVGDAALPVMGVIGGGRGNVHQTNVTFGTIGGGKANTLRTNASYGTIGGGVSNICDGAYATVAGGGVNTASGRSAFLGGGGGYDSLGFGPYPNTASGDWSVLCGGWNNVASGYSAAIGGGYGNSASGNAATIPGGSYNQASDFGSFAAGQNARALHAGAMVWSDSSGFGNLESTNANSVTMRAVGGYRLFSSGSGGVFLAPNGTSWAVMSDRNAKKDFEPIDARVILEKLAAMPITKWHYRWEQQSVTPHIGPMAQDFKAAFYPGNDDKSITTQEADGVALAAIQGLNQKLEEQRSDLRRKEKEIAELKESVNELRKLVVAAAVK
jgi:hypothetical protein